MMEFKWLSEKKYRVCPMPGSWSKLYEILLTKKQDYKIDEEIPPPSILSGWYSLPEHKHEQFIKQLIWADKYGFLNHIAHFLSSLSNEHWLYWSEENNMKYKKNWG